MKILLILFILYTSLAKAEVVVIVHIKNNIQSLTTQQVQDIFLGRTRNFPNGKFALPFDQSTPLRSQFYEKVSGRPVEQINAYWARIMFTGRASPPQQLPDDLAVLQTVRDNTGAIGYIDKAKVDKTIRVMLRLN